LCKIGCLNYFIARYRYEIAHFAKYAESIPNGETSMALSEAAKKNNIYVIGGTIPERDNEKLYNTCTIWAPDGKLVAKHRKVDKTLYI